MPLSYIPAKLSVIPPLFSPLLAALFTPKIPLWQRWRTLFLQPLALLAAALTAPSWLFSNEYRVLWIPTRGGRSVRCLVFEPAGGTRWKGKGMVDKEGGTRENTEKGDGSKSTPEPGKTPATVLRPLHIDLHGGGFTSGLPEHNARFCGVLAARTGAVVVSLSYALAPACVFPAAHDDVDDALAWLCCHAAEALGADPSVLTVGGSSAGGNLALSAAVGMARRGAEEAEKVGVKEKGETIVPAAYIGFYPVLDLRLRADQKSQPPGFFDPFAFLMPLFDVYGGTAKYGTPGPRDLTQDSRLHVTLSEQRYLPRRMLLVIAEIDILREEQMGFVERIQGEREAGGEAGGVDVLDVKEGFHGFLELPSFVLEKERMMVFERSVAMLQEVHRKHGFDLGKID